ncbi:MAG: PAS domain S-box protein, partial [Halodesulfurarchaeum sp.]
RRGRLMAGASGPDEQVDPPPTGRSDGLGLAVSTREGVGVGFVTGLGIAIFLTIYTRVRDLALFGDGGLLVVAVTLCLVGPLIAGGFYLIQRDDAPSALRVAAWTLLGSGPLLVFAAMLFFFRSRTAPLLHDPYLLLSGLVGLGAVAGFSFGLYEGALRDAEETAARTADRLGTVIQEAPIAIVTLDRDGIVTTWNRTAEHLFGYPASEIVGREYPLIPEGRSRTYETSVTGDAGSPVEGVEAIRERRDGVRLDVRVWTAPLSDGSSGFGGALVLLMDVSERKRQEQELDVLYRVLRHNLRNSLNVIKGNVQRLREALDGSSPGPLGDPGMQPGGGRAVGQRDGRAGPGSDGDSPGRAGATPLQARIDRAEAFAAVLDDETDRLIQVAEKAQAAERLLGEAGNHVPMSVADLCTKAVDPVRRSHPEASIEVDVEDDSQVLVRGPVATALRELIENGVVHDPDPRPTVRVRAFEDGDRAFIEVTDDGPGIPDGEWAVIEAGHETPVRHTSGIGLWMANWVVTTAGGTLQRRSCSDGGTTMRMSLPLAETPADQDDPDRDETAGERGSGAIVAALNRE